MIKVVKENNSIKITGHAGYKEYGKDIICASVSSIIYTTINGIKNIDESSINFIDENDIMEIIILKDNEITSKLINNMLDLINELSIEYPNNVKIIKK